MGDIADEVEDAYWASFSVSESMEKQEEIQRKIEAFQKIDEDVANGIPPF